jgi:pimeloyl-ACP methyl ester carboxylesterase
LVDDGGFDSLPGPQAPSRPCTSRAEWHDELFPFFGDLAAIDCPTLVVHGDHDFIVREAPSLVCDLITDARLVVIPDGGHYPFIEQPDAFTAALRTFVTDTTPRG